MKIYLSVVCDRHRDVEISAFKEKQSAIDEARECAEAYCSDTEDYEELAPSDNWLFHVTYSCEGDYAYVVESEIK